MKKHRILGFAIALTAGLALVGTGFSVFYFSLGSEVSLSGDDGISVQLAQATSGTFNFTLAKNTRLVFDSTISSNIQNKRPVSWQDEGFGSVSADGTSSSQSDSTSATDEYGSNDGMSIRVLVQLDDLLNVSADSVTITADLDFPDDYSKFIQLDNSISLGEEWSIKESQSSKLSFSISTSFSLSTMDKENGKLFSFPLPLKYIDGEEPADSDSLANLNNLEKTLTLTITTVTNDSTDNGGNGNA